MQGTSPPMLARSRSCRRATFSSSSSSSSPQQQLLHRLALLGISDLPPDLPPKLDLLLSAGLAPSHLKGLLSRRGFPNFAFASLRDVASKIALVGPLLLSKHPELFQLRNSNLQRKIDFLESLGVPLRKVCSCGGFGRVLKVKTETLEQRASFLTSIGMSTTDMAKIVSRYPYILMVDSERYVKPAVEFFEKERGLSREVLCKYIVIRPHIIAMSTGNIAQKLDCLEKLGLQGKSIHSCFVQFCPLSFKLLEARIHGLVSYGFNREEVVHLISCMPSMMSCRDENLAKKFDYLINTLNRDIKEALRFPAFLGMSLEKCIKPRCSVIARLEEKGLVEAPPKLKLCTILQPSIETFRRRFIDCLQDQGVREELKGMLDI